MRGLQRQLDAVLGAGRAPRQPDLQRKARAAFKRLAAEHGFAFKVCRDGYLECTPCAALPHGLTTAHHDWEESLGRVRHCIAEPAAVVGGCYSE